MSLPPLPLHWLTGRKTPIYLLPTPPPLLPPPPTSSPPPPPPAPLSGTVSHRHVAAVVAGHEPLGTGVGGVVPGLFLRLQVGAARRDPAAGLPAAAVHRVLPVRLRTQAPEAVVLQAESASLPEPLPQCRQPAGPRRLAAGAAAGSLPGSA